MDFFRINSERLLDLRRELAKADENYRLAREAVQSLHLRVNNLEKLMAEEVVASGKEELQAEFDEIMGKSGNIHHVITQDEIVNKTEIIANELLQENMQGRGATPKELYDLVRAHGHDTISLELTQSTLGKLKKRALVEQRSKRYFLSEQGYKYFEQPEDV